MRVTLSLRGDYAVRAMLALARDEHEALGDGRCAVHDAFSGATAALRAEVAGMTLAGLVDRGG